MNITIYKDPNSKVNIDQLPMRRDWMEDTFDRHAYQCYPISMANRLGYGLSFNVDFSFIWDGIKSSEDKHIKIISGSEIASTRRANGTVSLETGLIFPRNNNVSLLTMPPPNIFIDGIQCMSTIISSTALVGPLPIALMATRPNEIITIKAGTIVASILPISINEINNTQITIKNSLPEYISDPEWNALIQERSKVSQKLNSSGNWTHFYRNAVDHKGDPYGSHEAKKIIMRIINED